MKKTAKMTKRNARKDSMMSRAWALMRKGKTNEQVLVTLAKEFGLKEQHKHYAAWFRSALCRRMTEDHESKRTIEQIRENAHDKSYERGMSLSDLLNGRRSSKTA